MTNEVVCDVIDKTTNHVIPLGLAGMIPFDHLGVALPITNIGDVIERGRISVVLSMFS